VPAAIGIDPAPDPANPARMEVIHIPTHGVAVNGVVYVASGPGPHPTFVLFHGLPGNEKNLDLAQAIRRAGWNCVTLNYRGSWGSPGQFSFQHALEDAQAVLAFVRSPDNAKSLQIDSSRIVIGGHSIGGWVVAITAAHDHALQGAVLVSAGDLGGLAHAMPKPEIVVRLASSRETLNDGGAEALADEVMAHAAEFSFDAAAPQLVELPLLILSADDGYSPGTDRLIDAIHAKGGTKISAMHVKTDHYWSDNRITLESAVVTWLGAR
jgi:pimeloyl-ACP methyl ester carboxylesterase